MNLATAERAGLEAVERACSKATTPDELLEGVSGAMQRAVPHDASIWMAVDPATLIATAPSRVEGLDASMCSTFWYLEFHEHDTGQFVDLARGATASAMRLELGDRVGRSPRYRDFLRPQGYGDELRGVLRSGDRSWGVMGLYRQVSRPDFSADDVAFVNAVSRRIGDALRTHVRTAASWIGHPDAPGLLIIDRDGNATSANGEAARWLRNLWPLGMPPGDLDIGSFNLFDLRNDVNASTPLFALVSRARAAAAGRDQSPARLRLRDGLGRWVVLHASPVSGPGLANDAVALIIEAAKGAEIAPIIIDAYSLTPREREVLGAVSRGAATAEIAAELAMSPHTVRDHVKTVFDKVGVSSRGELVARLFGDHYADRLHESMVHTH